MRRPSAFCREGSWPSLTTWPIVHGRIPWLREQEPGTYSNINSLRQSNLSLLKLRQGRRDSWYIHMVMVSPEHQGKGIAKGFINLIREKVIHDA